MNNLQLHQESLVNLKSVLAKKLNNKCAVMVDLQGPYIKTGYLKNGEQVPMKKGSYLKILSDMAVEGDENVIGCS